MNLNVDPEWLINMAEKEDGKIISVGGLSHKVKIAYCERELLKRKVELDEYETP